MGIRHGVGFFDGWVDVDLIPLERGKEGKGDTLLLFLAFGFLLYLGRHSF